MQTSADEPGLNPGAMAPWRMNAWGGIYQYTNADAYLYTKIHVTYVYTRITEHIFGYIIYQQM